MSASLADFFASKNSEQNESLFSAFSQIATTTATPAPKVDVQQFVQHERQKIEKVQKDVEREEKYEAADIEKQIDAEIKEQEKAERFLSAEQKSERDKRSIFIGNVTTAVAPKKISKVFDNRELFFDRFKGIEKTIFEIRNCPSNSLPKCRFRPSRNEQSRLD